MLIIKTDKYSKVSDMDYLWFALMVLVMVGAFWLLKRSEKATKNKHKIAAYRLLDAPDPSAKEIKSTIKLLRLYRGSWRKDKEFTELINRLITRLNKIDGTIG
jgi:hypothetical protein